MAELSKIRAVCASPFGVQVGGRKIDACSTAAVGEGGGVQAANGYCDLRSIRWRSSHSGRCWWWSRPLVTRVGIGSERSFGVARTHRNVVVVVGIGDNQLRRGSQPTVPMIGVQACRVGAGYCNGADEGPNGVASCRCRVGKGFAAGGELVMGRCSNGGRRQWRAAGSGIADQFVGVDGAAASGRGIR